MTNKQNFEKDINVPSKEQTIIDGIQFNKFGDFYVDYDLSGKFQSISSSAKEYKILKSLIKQLARKTQECEELKKKFSKFFNIDNQECWDIAFLKDENARYKQALDEIEENCLKAQDPCQEDWDRKTENFAKPILDIIRKAKGADNHG